MRVTQQEAVMEIREAYDQFHDVFDLADCHPVPMLVPFAVFSAWLHGRAHLSRALEEYEQIGEHPEMSEQHYCTMSHYCGQALRLANMVRLTLEDAQDDEKRAAYTYRMN